MLDLVLTRAKSNIMARHVEWVTWLVARPSDQSEETQVANVRPTAPLAEEPVRLTPSAANLFLRGP